MLYIISDVIDHLIDDEGLIVSASINEIYFLIVIQPVIEEWY